ncbi:serine/threonine-protein kinase [Umezawaea endophytica]|uniref:non-specific serine/threonine protein kinase n=1 Tax=Umezawaea endophytica TaxID=1654476 RepID=A0A9X2VI53_9PSEU|nr:serine/threonine-protein kinase [Umezawaea endophytica]MCS7477063.1 protein kinase [Umezawaea endophytica]
MSLPANGELLADRYELADVIGIGGMAEVYRAWDTRLRRFVAVKLFTANADLEDTRRFDNEVRILAGLSHPALVSVYDVGTAGRTPFVVLRLVDGRTLRHRMSDGPLPVDEVRSLGAAVADALAHVHDRGVVHRDVKPSNILLDEGGTPYLADFGLAHSVGSTRFTRTGLIVGTAAYLAPEQVRGAEVDSAADVYALGLVLLECLTGRCEYTGSDVEAIVSRLHRSPVVPEGLPADLARLLELMTSQSPADRPTARLCADVLRTGHPTAPFTAPARRSPSRRNALVASAAGLLGAVGIGWALLPGSAPAVSEPPAAVTPAVAAVESTTAAPETTAQFAAAPETTPVVAQQPAQDAEEPAPARAPEPRVHAPAPAPAQPHGPGGAKSPAHPGHAKKAKP